MTDCSEMIARGQTAYAGETPNANSLMFEKMLGQIREFPDQNPNPNATTLTTKTNLRVACIFLRNTTGATLAASDVVRFNNTDISRNCGAKVSALSQWFMVVDEYLPSTGLIDDDCGWFVIKGPTTANAVMVSGAQAAGQLGVSSSTTSGKVDFTSGSPGSATIGQLAAAYGYNAVTEGAIADGATSYRIIINRNPLGW